MRPESLKLFAKLMENGYITREQSPAYYEYYNDPEIASELAIMEQELDFTLYKTNGRLYLLPDPNNELFSQDNNDFRRSVGNEKLEELYLLNYMAIFLLHELYGGKGNTLLRGCGSYGNPAKRGYGIPLRFGRNECSGCGISFL